MPCAAHTVLCSQFHDYPSVLLNCVYVQLCDIIPFAGVKVKHEKHKKMETRISKAGHIQMQFLLSTNP